MVTIGVRDSIPQGDNTGENMIQGRARFRAGFQAGTALLLLTFSSLMLPLSATADGHESLPRVLEAARDELERTMTMLADAPDPPYFLAYEINETHTANVSSRFGELVASSDFSVRQLDIDLRVGTYDLDNSRPMRGRGQQMFLQGGGMTLLPLGDDVAALRNALWLNTDIAYKQAVEALTRIRTDVNIQVDPEDQSSDFSRQAPNRHIEPLVELEFDADEWEPRIEAYTRPFAAHGDIFYAQATLNATRVNRWLVNSDGTLLQTSQPLYQLSINAGTRAEDGMWLPRNESFTAFDPDDLPTDEEIATLVDRMIDDLLALRDAPIVDPYVGPAILSGRAAGVFFHEVLGHRVEGHRVKSEFDGQTFKKMIGENILPPEFSIVFDPTRRQMADIDLAGHYLFDNEGVRARPVSVVEDGQLQSFLMSRTPIEGFPESNGHGRRQPGFKAVSRQSNLMVESSRPVTSAQLEAMLIERIRAEGKPFGLIFEEIQGGFTQTGRVIPNAFNVLPILVYRLFPDGTKELVRGVDLIGTPLTALTKIVAADDQPAVFNGVCGAESGGVPVSASSPALLISQIEVQKKAKAQQRLPILDAPLGNGEAGSDP